MTTTEDQKPSKMPGLTVSAPSYRASSPIRKASTLEEKDVPYRLLLSGEMAGRLIGKNGVSIKQIRDIASVSLSVLEKETPAPIIAGNERIVRILGPYESKDMALRLILHRIKDFTTNEVTGQKNEEWIDVTSDDPCSKLHDEEVTCALSLLVPDAACSHVIGAKGDSLKRLTEETSCTVQVPREAVIGYPGQRRILMTGDIKQVRAAAALVHQLIVEMVSTGQLRAKNFDLPASGSTPGLATSMNPLTSLLPASGASTALSSPVAPTSAYAPTRAGEVPVLPIRLLVSKEEAAWVVGKKGVKIGRLREDTAVDINIDDAEYPPFMANERIIAISGPTAAKHHVLLQILTDLEKHPQGSTTLKILIPADHFGIVMGKRGEQMKKITIATCANIQKLDIKETAGGEGERKGVSYRVLSIEGSDKQRSSAALMIVQLLDQRIADEFDPRKFCMSQSEGALMSLAASAGVAAQRPIRMQLMLPSVAHLAQLMGPGASGAELNAIGKRSGCELQLAGTAPDVSGQTQGCPILSLSGSPLGNAFAFLLIQERLLSLEVGKARKGPAPGLAVAEEPTTV